MGRGRWAGPAAAEPLEMGGVGGVEHGLPVGHDRLGVAGVDVGGMQIPDAGVVVHPVVPVGEPAHPRAGLDDVGEAGGVIQSTCDDRAT